MTVSPAPPAATVDSPFVFCSSAFFAFVADATSHNERRH